MRDDLIIEDYQRDVFELLVRWRDAEGIQVRVGERVGLGVVGGMDKSLGRELGRLVGEFSRTQYMEQLDTPLIAQKITLKIFNK
ncbi:hypothetical protein [Pseudomonas sp. GM78]|uniref:hypothetical protein n=1 Tax=Pseudomonas sp. GM78 TaxID=1144337 RepID=UPI001EE666AA|nr:hypothetical protein [Pseudomonas sp. GM78]